MKKLITTINLSKSFDKTILSNINLDIYENEILVILGKSGVGKTTLIDILSKVDLDYSGEICYHKDLFINTNTPLPVVFQEFDQLLPWFTVGKNIKLSLSKMALEEHCRFDEVVASVGLTDSIDKYPNQLSGGMKQRTAIARALMCNSKILFMDEPFGSIDITLRRKLQDLIISINKKFNKTIVFITHDIDEAIYLGHRIVIIDEEQKYYDTAHINDIYSDEHLIISQLLHKDIS